MVYFEANTQREDGYGGQKPENRLNPGDGGNIGINIGVASPMAFLPFSVWNDSFLGDLNAQEALSVEFYIQTKIIVELWPKE